MKPIWIPSQTRINQTNLTRFSQFLHQKHQVPLSDYKILHQWSIDQKEHFWDAVWEFCEIRGDKGHAILKDNGCFSQAKWFPNAQLNFAENLLKRRDKKTALIFRGEKNCRREISYHELYQQVAQFAGQLRKAGITVGDCVAGVMPNTIETAIAMLATASIGATWSSCSPDFGVQGIVDRLGQISPKVIVTTDGYFYNGKIFDCLEKIKSVCAQLANQPQVVVVGFTTEHPTINHVPNTTHWSEFQDSEANDILFERLPFSHPLYVMYSSGTTGKPKCIVHSAGGTLIQHLKELILHTDLSEKDTLFYFTTCGWMMWNWMISSIAIGSTTVLYDGSPFANQPSQLIDLINEESVTVFGTSAKYLSALEKESVIPIKTHQLTQLKTILSTGSPLLPENFNYVYQSIKKDVLLSSISGGTDIISCFALGNPTLPVYQGELQCIGLGMDVKIFDTNGNSVINQKGELVCCSPFPSMPIGFWDDENQQKFHAAYFETFPGVWHHGDWVVKTKHGGFIILGRSDATLNPGGVRIGTAEIYRQVEQIPQVRESVAVGQDFDNDVRVILFVVLKEDEKLTDELVKEIKSAIRSGASPRHVPAKVIAVQDIPRTRSGKISEIAVRDVINGKAVKNTEALANAESLKLYEGLEELTRA